MDNNSVTIKIQKLKGLPRKFQTLRGFRDFLPKDALKRAWLENELKKVFYLYGYDPIITPALEYAQVLIGKYGDEADKMLYTFKDRGKRQVGLRYDQTVPTARFISDNLDRITIPFRRYQIQPTWRQEKPQKGRYREFVQVDADIYGVKNELADAEVITLIYAIYKNLGFKKMLISINSRDVLFELLKKSGIQESIKFETIRIIDKLNKIGKEGVEKELTKSGLPKSIVKKLLENVDRQNPTKSLDQVFQLIGQLGVPKNYWKFDPSLARGLDYYTGTIFEVDIPGFTAGSVLGGGRYDNLIEKFAGVDIPGVGFGLGFDRTLEACEQFGLVPVFKTVTKVLVTVFSNELLVRSIEVAKMLRDGGINTELYPDPEVKLDKQLKYADKKGIPYVVIIGPDEVQKETVTLKNLKTGKQEVLSSDQLAKKLL